jgi:hypothetical protein
MVSIRYGRHIATYDSNGWTSSDRAFAEMLNALRLGPESGSIDADPHVAVAKLAIARLRAGEIVKISSEPSALAGLPSDLVCIGPHDLQPRKSGVLAFD